MLNLKPKILLCRICSSASLEYINVGGLLTILDIVPNGLNIGGAILVLLCNATIFIKNLLGTKE